MTTKLKPVTESVKVATAIKRFLAEDPTMLGNAPSTRVQYQLSFDALTRVIPSQLRASELRPEHFEKAYADLKNGAGPEENATRKRVGVPPRPGRGPGALQNSVSHYRMFVKFLHRRGYLTAARNPMGGFGIKRIKPKRLIKDMVMPSTPEVFQRLLEEAGKRHPRDRAAVALGLYTGFRESELLEVRIGGVDFDDANAGTENHRPQVRVYREKQDEWHTVPMCVELEAELRRWLAWLNESVRQPLESEWFVLGARAAAVPNPEGRFKSRATGRLTPKTPVHPWRKTWKVSLDIKAALEAAGMSETAYRTGAHTLRRMGGIKVENEHGIRAAKTFFGHKAQSATETYLQYNDDANELFRQLRPFQAPEPDPGTAVEPEERSNVISLASRRRVA